MARRARSSDDPKPWLAPMIAGLAAKGKLGQVGVPPADYPRYLSSSLWQGVRRRVLERDSYRCQRCGGKATEVHHRDYHPRVLLGEDDSQLAALCEGCHTVVHYKDSGHARPFVDWDGVLATKDERREAPPYKLDMRRKELPLPPEWARMNAHQREAWSKRWPPVWWARKAVKGDMAALINFRMALGAERPTADELTAGAWAVEWLAKVEAFLMDKI